MIDKHENFGTFFKWFQPRARHILWNVGIADLNDLEGWSDIDLIRLPNCGQGTLRHIREVEARLRGIDNERPKLSIRDQFAMAAMQGQLSAIDRDEDWNVFDVSAIAYDMADAMLEARKK